MKSEQLLHAIGQINDDLIFAANPAESQKKRAPRLRPIWAVAAAALLVLTLAIGVGASGALGSLENLFGPVFPGAQSGSLDPELMEKLGSPVGISASDNGVTVTVDSMIRDRFNCTLVVTVENSGVDGKGIDFNGNTLQVGGMEFSGAARWSSDPVSDDGKARYTVSWASDEGIPAGKATVLFSDLVINLHAPLMEQTIEGSWELELDTAYEDLSVELPAGQTLPLEGTEVAIDRVTVSPLSLLVAYTVNLNGADLGRSLDDGIGKTLGQRLTTLDIVLTKKDGTRIATPYCFPQREDGHIRNGGTHSYQEDGMLKCRCSLVFDQPLPLEELDSLSIEGVEIPLDELAR